MFSLILAATTNSLPFVLLMLPLLLPFPLFYLEPTPDQQQPSSQTRQAV